MAEITPSQRIPYGQVDDPYDKLYREHQELIARQKRCNICGGLVDLTNAIRPTETEGRGGKR